MNVASSVADYPDGVVVSRRHGNDCRWRRRQQGAAEALIAPKDFAAASEEQAQTAARI